MRAVTGRELARAVEGKGWTLLRVTGSHHIYGKADSQIRLSIPIHDSRPLKTGLAAFLIKQAGLSESDL